MDKIIIKNLQSKCIIGDYDWERKRPQKISLNLEMEADLSQAIENDALGPEVLDYNRLAKEVLTFVEQSKYQLIETLADAVALLALKKFPISSIKVRLTKPSAIKAADAAIVEVVRSSL